jgi:hypothetical protein
MKPKLHPEVCPVASLAGLHDCPGKLCGWYRPAVEKCLLAIIIEALGQIGEVTQEVKNGVDHLVGLVETAAEEGDVPAESDV